MSTCANHPEKPSSTSCNGCNRPFCDGCLVRFEKLALCAACKARYLTGVEERPAAGTRRPAAATPASAGGARTGRDARRGTPLQWIGGSAALVFAALFVFVIVATLAEPFNAWRRDRRYAETFETLVTIGSAIERHRADKGALPAELKDLVPTYLASLPDDPYAKKPPRYDKTRLWSVGEDGKDDDGETPADIVYRVD